MEVWLFKTPFDNSYKNVVDFIKYKDKQYQDDIDYKSILRKTFYAKYNHKELEVSLKSFKRSLNITSLTLPYKFFDIREYNYTIISYENELFFYFINEIVSNNDNDINPSSTLTLEWDVWCNNINNIEENSSYNSISTHHFDRFDLYDNEILPNLIMQDEVDVATKKIDKPFFNRYIPVFRVLQVKNFLELKLTDGDITLPMLGFSQWIDLHTKDGTGVYKYVYIYPKDSLGGHYGRNVTYYITGLYDTVKNEYVKGAKVRSKKDYYEIRYDPGSTSSIDNVFELYTDKPGNIPDFPRVDFIPEYVNDYLTSTYISFNSPFSYTYDEENKLLTMDCCIVNPHSFGSAVNLPVCIGDYITYSEVSSNKYGIAARGRINSNYFMNDIDINIDLTDVNKYGNKNYYKITSKYSDLIEPCLDIYPFKYYSIEYGNERIPLKPFTPYDYNQHILYSVKTPQAQIGIFNKNYERIYSPVNYFTQESVINSFGTLADISYQIRNGAQLQASKDINQMQSIFNFFSSASPLSFLTNPFGPIKASFEYDKNAMKFSALEKDLSTTPGSWYPSTGECDINYQDRIRLVENRFINTNINYINLVKIIYYNGYNKLVVDDIFNNNRISFDYCQTNNCDLSSLNINSEDRKKLCNIFNNGVTKWHILIDENDNVIRYQSPTKDIDVIGNNIEHKFETDPVYRNWVNS